MELAEVYVANIYGLDASEGQKPYRVEENSDMWTIKGKPPIALGGNFEISISKSDGRVIKLTHSR